MTSKNDQSIFKVCNDFGPVTFTFHVPQQFSQPLWQCDLLGDARSIVFNLTTDVPWWKRKTMTFFFGTKWTKLE